LIENQIISLSTGDLRTRTTFAFGGVYGRSLMTDRAISALTAFSIARYQAH
jgi:hypothetical protein